MKILIVAKDIPPYVSIPGSIQRVVLFSYYLIKKGHEVSLIGSGRRDNLNNGPIWWEEYLNKVKMFPLLPGRLLKYFDFRKEQMIKKNSKEVFSHDLKINHDISKDKREEKKGLTKKIIWSKIIYRLIRKIYNNLFIFGDDGILEIFSLKKHLRKIIDDLKPDILIVSTPPHSWLRIIPWVKSQYPALPLIVDFRDGWTSIGLFRAKSFIRKYWQDYIERRIISSADGLVFVSPGLEKFYVDKYKCRLPVSELIYNGYNEKLWKNVKKEKVNKVFLSRKHRPCIIKHIGGLSFSLESFRSPYNIFLVLESCLKKGLISSNDFILSFTGFVDKTEILNVFPLLKPMIQINDPVSPLEALIEMKKTDLLLVIHSKEEGAEEVLTGKMFDYLRAEKPILAVTTSNCGIRKFLVKMDIGIWADINDLEDISKKMINILKIFESNEWSEWCKEKTPSASKISKYSRESQYKKFEKFIVKIVNNKGVNK